MSLGRQTPMHGTYGWGVDTFLFASGLWCLGRYKEYYVVHIEEESCLKEEAEEIISSLELTEENYEVALQLLKDRYDNKRVIIQKHVRALMDLPTIGKESALELRKFIDAMSMHLRALKSLGQPSDTWETLLIHSFTAKLDRVTHQEWEKSVTGTEKPTMKEFTSFLEKRCQILQVASINLDNKSVPPSKLNNVKKQVFAVVQSSDGCAIRKDSHKVYMCDSLKNLSIKDRFEKVKSSKLCFNCLKVGHSNSDCKWSGCKKCGKKHNTLLHYDANEFNTRNHQTGNAQPEASTANFNGVAYKAYSALVSPQSVLSAAVINIKNQDGNLAKAQTLNQIETRIKYSVRTEINSRCTCYKETVEFLVLPNICNHLPNEYIDKRTIKVPLRKPLADPEFNKPLVIDALLGVELFFHVLCIGQERIPGPTALLQKTKLGLIPAGKINSSTQSNKPRQCMLSFNALHKSLTKFWEIEEVQNQKFLSEEEHEVEPHFQETTTRDPVTGRYTVRLPFNEKIKQLGESRKIAERQFYALERKLKKNPTLKSDYIDNMRESIQLGHAVRIEAHEIRDKHCFLPYHVVIKDSSSTTKHRIVNNASAKTSTGVSLNDGLMVGAVVQDGSFEIALRFREHQIVFLADIEKMYKQIRLHPEDAQYQLILSYLLKEKHIN
ncbi:uncharacterized protein LOC135164549 [Diachasmimorpha longicaudata]|uniref:uncharacterized protein LOC135164549 n=1 Tax=Diachasmimorpha longicaudata TaxID=58733 RepID=UPI0030B88629